jgi:sugar O-acyltransferase (sialic acid O-acetyltransferase NeuD family)
MTKVVIFGIGEIAQIAEYYFSIDSNYEVVAFTLDEAFIDSDSLNGKPIVPFENLEKTFDPKFYKMFIALSYKNLNRLRESKFNEAKKKGYELVSYISSRSSFLSQFPCGENCFIFEDNTIQPFVRIGDNVTLWSGNHIGHHSTINDHNFISSHVVISGHCTIKSNTFIGVNATIGHNVTIESENIVGAGCVITKSTNVGEVYVPAKSIKLEKNSSQIEL